MRVAYGMSGIVLAVMLSGAGASAQTVTTTDKMATKVVDKPEGRPASDWDDTRPMQTFYLKNEGEPNNGNEILTGLRLLLPPSVKMYLYPTHNAIMMRAKPEELLLAQKILDDIDRPKKVYRVTYTINELDGGKLIGTQHFSMIAASGARTTLKDGSRTPIVTGSYDEGKNGSQTQFTYLDVGLNLDATVNEIANGVTLRSKAEQSSVAEGEPRPSPQDPIIRQAILEGTSNVTLGKPLVLGSLDVFGSTRHLNIEVVVDEVH
jgi:type II secretory pathway component GspD/PulD (secretin)